MSISAIIVCGGSSSRMNGVNKLLLPLGNTNVAGRSMLAFEHCPEVGDIVVVCRKAWNSKAPRLCRGRRDKAGKRFQRIEKNKPGKESYSGA